MKEPPTMFRRPSDPPEPPLPLASSDTITTMHTEWARVHAATASTVTMRQRMARKVRARTARMGIGTDRKMLGDLIRAIDAVATRCDELSDRVSSLEVSVDDMARILGEEVTRLRAVVEQSLSETARGSSSSAQ